MRTVVKIFRALARRERFVLFAALLLCAVSGLIMAGLLLREVTTLSPAYGGTYVEGVVGQPAAINPVLAASDIDRSLVRLLFASLSELAEKIEPSADYRSWNVRLREDLRWSDGHKLTSDDVIFTLERLQDQSAHPPAFEIWKGVAAERLSELELQFKLGGPYVSFSEILGGFFPVPKHLFADTPTPNWRLSTYLLVPVGNGPYVVKRYDERSNGTIASYDLVPNEHYSGKPPFLERFVFRFFQTPADLLAAFNTGVVDGFAATSPDDLRAVQRPRAVTSFTFPGYYAIFLNTTRNAGLKDVRVRRALQLALDRSLVVRESIAGYGEPATGPFPLASPHVNADPSYAPDAARALLDQAGWLPNERGERRKTVQGSDLPLSVELIVPRIPFLERTAEIVESSWRAVGVAVKKTVLPLDEVAVHRTVNRDYEALLFGHFLSPASDLYLFWHSRERFSPGLNFSLYANPEADRVIEALRQESDPIKQSQHREKLQTLIATDAPAIFLFTPYHLFVTTKNLRGVSGNILGAFSDRFAQAPLWYLKTNRVLNW